MPKEVRPSQERSSPLRRLFVSDADIAAAQKLLEMLIDVGRSGPGDPSDTHGPAGAPGDRRHAVRCARREAAFRERRLHAFEFTAEAPFLLLVALYSNEQWEPIVTLTRLTQLSWLSMSTTLRWLDVLVGQGLIDRSGDAEDGRKTLLSLTAKGRSKLDDIFA